MKRIFVILLFTLVGVGAFASDVLKVGLSANYPPFEYVEDGKYMGYDIDVLNELSKKIGFKFEIVNDDFSSLFNALRNEQIDMIFSALAITPQRQSEFDLTKTYFESTNMYICKKSDKMYVSPQSLEGKTIGVVDSGSVQYFAASKIKDAKIVVTKSIVQLIGLVKKGKIDAMIIDSALSPIVLGDNYRWMSIIDKKNIHEFEKKNRTKLEIFYTEITTNRAVIAFKKGKHTKLIEQINEAIKELQNSKQLDVFKRKYGIR